MATKRITKRWLLNNFGVIVGIVLLVIAAAAIGISTYYYNFVRQAVASRANSALMIFEQYAEDRSTDFSVRARSYVSGFVDKHLMEMMALDAEGNILITSSGFEPDNKEFIPDYHSALTSPQRRGESIETINGHRVLAVTYLSSDSSPQGYAIRYLVDMTNVDRQILLIISILAVIGLAIILLVLFSSSYFINSIVNPVGEVGNTARRIAQGDFAARLEKRQDDEIGELCDIINYMAEELANTEKIKNDFISSVSHELRTPLTAIQGWGETIRNDGGNDKEVLEKGMKVIISETGRLASMVEELLDFSRMESGRLKLIRSKIDVLAELSEAVMMYTQRAEREGIALVWEDTGLIVPVYGDKNKLRQVFVNVIDNAIKYSDQGDTVTITAKADAHHVVITVADTGLGIKPEDIPNVKTKFYKANFSRRGSGIGLAVGDEIISRHGGSLDITSVYNEGTTVTITLPVYHKQDELAQIDNQRTAPFQNE